MTLFHRSPTLSSRSSSSAGRGPLAPLFLLVLAACSGSYDEAAVEAPPVDGPGAPSPGEPPKAPPQSGAPTPSDLDEKLGVFVSATAAAGGDGTRARPLPTIGAGVALAKQVGKRVYVCTGTYREALAVADSISVVGGLGCSGGVWTTGAPKSRLDSPTSPAVLATDIRTATRIEGFEIVAPDATEPSGSSFGVFAVRSPALTIASSRITAGNAMAGADGAEGVQLAHAGDPNGAPASSPIQCMVGTCAQQPTSLLWRRKPGGAGGNGACAGAAGHDAETGGAGGSGGLWEFVPATNIFMSARERYSAIAADPTPAEPRTGGAAAAGVDGANAQTSGVLTADGFSASAGASGTDGTPGKAGSGSAGVEPTDLVGKPVGSVWTGIGGAGGGAGGCPGLAGGPGASGGASFGIALFESPITLDQVDVVAGRGGNAGRGAFGSVPTPAGAGGAAAPGYPGTRGFAGSRGGAAGVSGNGAAGPSAGIAHVGAPPKRSGGTVKAGAPGNGIEERSRTDDFGTTKTIPAAPPGLAMEVLAL